VIDGRTAIPRGSDVVAKLVADKQAGRLTGRTELTLDLQSVTVNGRAVEVATQEVIQQGKSRTTQTATRTGGAAALGAVIGAIAGGGKGAAIGAVTGAAAGGAVQVLTKGPKVKIPSETRLTFTLQNPLSL
jgi:outer membrane lipoprotein SlyB